MILFTLDWKKYFTKGEKLQYLQQTGPPPSKQKNSPQNRQFKTL